MLPFLDKAEFQMLKRKSRDITILKYMATK